MPPARIRSLCVGPSLFSSAFSLVELLVVLSIIGLLVGLVLPSLQSARSAARTLGGLANLSQIGRAVYAYATDHHDRLPIGWRQSGFPNVQPDDTNWAWLTNAQMTGAPSTRSTLAIGQFSKIFRDPNAAVNAGSLHYSAHPVLMPDQTRTTLAAYDLGRLHHPAQKLLIADGCQIPPAFNSNATLWQINNGSLFDAENQPVPFNPADPDNDDPIDPGPNVDQIPGQGHIRWRQHDGKSANMLFADGHAASMQQSQITKRNLHLEE